MPRTKPPDERRADLLDAAEELFSKKGIAATPLEEITRSAGVAKGTFYLHFRSKEDIVAGLQQRFGERFAKRIDESVAAERGWAEKLDAFVAAMFVDYTAERHLHEILFHHPSDAGTALEGDPGRNILVDHLAGLLDAGVAAGAYDVDDTDTSAVLLYSALHGAFDSTLYGTRAPSRKRFITAAQLLMRRGVGLA